MSKIRRKLELGDESKSEGKGREESYYEKFSRRLEIGAEPERTGELRIDEGARKAAEAKEERERLERKANAEKLIAQGRFERAKEEAEENARLAAKKESDELFYKVGRAGKLMRIAARMVVGFTLIYYGGKGIVNLVGLVIHPPARGVDWTAFIGGIAMLIFFWMIRYLFQRTMQERKERDTVPKDDFLGRHPGLMEYIGYTVEGLMFFATLTMVLGVLLTFLNPIRYPTVFFFAMVYVTMSYVLMRKLIADIVRP